MSDPRTTLTDKLSFHLRLAHEAAQQSLAGALAESGLAPVHADVLALIGAHPGIKPSEIAQALGRDRSSITAALHVLERSGLVRRDVTMRDRRSSLLHLTEAGDAALQGIAATVRSHDALLDRTIGADDKSRLMELLRRIYVALTPGGDTR